MMTTLNLTGSKPDGLRVEIVGGNLPLEFRSTSIVSGVEVKQVASVRLADMLLRTEQYLTQKDGYNSFFALGQDGKSLMEFRGMALDPADFHATIMQLLLSSPLESNDPRITFMMRFEAKTFSFDESDPRLNFVNDIKKLTISESRNGRWLSIPKPRNPESKIA